MLSTIAVLTCTGFVLFVQEAAAQGSHAYASLGAGATNISGGVAWMLPNTPVALGGELGLGNLFWSSLTASYHPFARRIERKVHPFVRVSVTSVGSSPYNATGVSLGGGVAWWPWRRIGFRTEAINFWAAFDEDQVPSGEDFTPRLWAVRGGVALRW